jgi:hypothetical protein
LRRVVDFVAVLLKVPQEVSGTQVVLTRFVAILMLMRGVWSRGNLRPDVACWWIADTLSDVGHGLTCACGSCI